MDDKFLFGDLISLQLHKHEEDVRDIVDRAQKELLIEVQLQALSETWAKQEVLFIPLSPSLHASTPPCL